jgi:hypothetical protein
MIQKSGNRRRSGGFLILLDPIPVHGIVFGHVNFEHGKEGGMLGV